MKSYFLLARARVNKILTILFFLCLITSACEEKSNIELSNKQALLIKDENKSLVIEQFYLEGIENSEAPVYLSVINKSNDEILLLNYGDPIILGSDQGKFIPIEQFAKLAGEDGTIELFPSGEGLSNVLLPINPVFDQNYYKEIRVIMLGIVLKNNLPTNTLVSAYIDIEL